MTEKHHEDATTQAANFANQFLIAMPGMVEGSLAGSVIYVCEHTERGALGLVINRPTDLTLGTLFERIDLTLEIGPVKDTFVFFGGPVQTDRGFVLHRSAEGYDSTLRAGNDIRVTVSQDILGALARGEGPDPVLVALGYAGWGAGQLEAELGANAWLSVPADQAILFETPFEQRWSAAIGLLGVDIHQITTYAGHA